MRKLSLRILFWFLLLTAISVAGIVVAGYFAARQPVSYLPDLHKYNIESPAAKDNRIELATPWYVLYVGKKGSVNVKTPDGKTIVSGLSLYAEYDSTENLNGPDTISVKSASDSTISIIDERPHGVQVNIIFTVHRDRPKMDVHIRTCYRLNTVIRREALVTKFDVPITEVYRKNRQIDVGTFDPEYWLQRQGVRFGSGPRSALVYHTPSVSSLQLDSKRNLLFVNLDYYLDHPQIHIPFQKDGGGRWIDISPSKYIAGDKRNNDFSFYFGDFLKVTPRIMLLPNGYLAGYVFTEHADEGIIRTHRAVYFGAEDISNAYDAVGGFVGHKIPVTKSVFYAEPGNPADASIIDDPDRPQFLDYLDQLNATGLYDICLHTPDGNSADRERLVESIKFMKERFNTITWIDHSMYSGENNRESFVSDGLNPDSRYFAADLWEKCNTRYFWSSAVELIGSELKIAVKEEIKKLRLLTVSKIIWRNYLSSEELKHMNFPRAFFEIIRRYKNHRRYINSFQTNKGESFPSPLYWQNPTRSNKFYSWATDYVTHFNGKTGETYYDTTILNKLVSDWGIFINHSYPTQTRTIENNGFWTETNGKIIINPGFDKMLGLMAHMRDKGDLCITTIRDLLNYWIMTDNVSFDYIPNGIIRVINNNNEAIKGFSLAVRANNVRVNGQIPSYRKVENETIFWFDISARDHVNLEVKP